MTVIYDSPGQKMINVKEFFDVALFSTLKKLLYYLASTKKKHDLTLIITADFNINFSDKKTEPLFCL